MKNPEWNMALEEDEDWKAALSSEVFRNFVRMATNKEGIFSIAEDVVEEPKEEEDEEEEDIDKVLGEIEVEDVAEEDVDSDSDGEIDDEFGVDDSEECTECDADSEESDTDTVESDTVYKESDVDSGEYETGAGSSDFIDVGLTDDTLNQIKEMAVVPKSAIKEVMDVYNEVEIAEAEEELGLTSNAAYIFGGGKEE